MQAFLQLGWAGATLRCIVWPSGSGFSCCGAGTRGTRALAAAARRLRLTLPGLCAHRLNSCGAQVSQHVGSSWTSSLTRLLFLWEDHGFIFTSPSSSPQHHRLTPPSIHTAGSPCTWQNQVFPPGNYHEQDGGEVHQVTWETIFPGQLIFIVLGRNRRTVTIRCCK